MKFFILCIFIAAANSAPGLSDHFSGPISFSHAEITPAVVKAAPIVHYAAPIHIEAPVVKAVAPAATSYATFTQVHVSHPQPVVKYTAVAHAAPVVKFEAAPVVKFAAAPAHIESHSGFDHSFGHGW